DRREQHLRRRAEQLRPRDDVARQQPRERDRLRLYRRGRHPEQGPAAGCAGEQRWSDRHAGDHGGESGVRRRRRRLPAARDRPARHHATAGREVRHRRLRARGRRGAGGGAAAPAAPSGPAAAVPTVVGEAAPTVGAGSATVSASVNPNGSATSVLVQYGTTTAYGQQTAAVAIGAGTTLQVVS